MLDTLPKAKENIVFDRFRTMKHMGEAVDKVRREENATLTKNGESLLKGSRFIWLYSRENFPEKHWDKFCCLKASDLKTGRAWAIKENLRYIWDYNRRAWAKKFWKKWCFWATHSRLEPVKKAANTLKSHFYGILNYARHQITNASA